MRKIRLIILWIIIIITLLYGMTFFHDYPNTVKNNEKDKVNFYVEKLLNEEIDCGSKEEIDEMENCILQRLQDEKNKEIISKSNFILGYIDIINFRLSDAIDKFNKSIKNFTENMDIEIKAKVYYELSRAYLNEEEYEKSAEAFNVMSEMCTSNNKIDTLISLSINRAYDLYNIGNDLDTSIELMEDILSIAKEINHESTYEAYFVLGVLYWYDERNIESINCKLKSLNLMYEQKLYKSMSNMLTDIGIDYLYSKNYDEAIKYLLKAVDFTSEDKQEEIVVKSYALVNLAESYTKLNDFENAQKYYNMFQEIIEDYENLSYKEQLKIVMDAVKVDLEIRMNNPNEALILLNSVKARYESIERFYFYDFDISINELYGDLNYKMGNYNQALEYHKKAQNDAIERNLTYLYDIHNDKIYLDYKALGDDKNVIKYLEKNNEFKSEQQHNSNIQYSQYLMKEFEAEKSMNIITSLRNQKNNMKIIIIALAVVTLMIFVFAIIIFKKNKEINRLNKLFKNLSETDGLTKLSNRRALDTYLSDNWNLIIKKRSPISFIMMDIDYFKKYNDNYGHPEGDMILKSVAEAIKQSCRSYDFVARYGGEEFVIVLLKTDKAESISVVDRIRKNIDNLNLEHKYSEISSKITLSIGICTTCSINDKTYEDYIKDADKALYAAKEKGRNTYVHADDI
ncbi:MAG: diguanylate cyclase [Clostridium sp.]